MIRGPDPARRLPGCLGRLDQREDITQSRHAEPAERRFGRVRVYDVTARAYQDQRVAHINLRDRVRGQDHGAALVREQPQHEHHALVQPRIKPGGGLVEEQDLGLVQQLARDRYAFALPSAEGLHQLVPLLEQPHGGQHMLNASVPGR